jgi:hypothetical protein
VNEKLKGIEMERTEESENERKESFDLQFQARCPLCSKFLGLTVHHRKIKNLLYIEQGLLSFFTGRLLIFKIVLFTLFNKLAS